MLSGTYTFAILQVSREAYEEIKAKLDDYQDQFHKTDEYGLVLDMHGIALAATTGALVASTFDDKVRMLVTNHKVRVAEGLDPRDSALSVVNAMEMLLAERDTVRPPAPPALDDEPEMTFETQLVCDGCGTKETDPWRAGDTCPRGCRKGTLVEEK